MLVPRGFYSGPRMGFRSVGTDPGRTHRPRHCLVGNDRQPSRFLFILLCGELMERVAQIQRANGRGFRQIGTAGTGYLVTVAMLGIATLPAPASAATSLISGSPATSIVAASAVYDFKPTVSSSAATSKLKFSIKGKPSWATFISTTGELYGGTYPSNVGTYSNISISATNGSETTTIGPFAIAVLAKGSTSTGSTSTSTGTTTTSTGTTTTSTGSTSSSSSGTTTAAGTLQLSASTYAVGQAGGT